MLLNVYKYRLNNHFIYRKIMFLGFEWVNIYVLMYCLNDPGIVKYLFHVHHSHTINILKKH